MSSEELKPCPCGAACNTEEGPYPINHARDLWRLDCVEPDCGWSIVAGSSEEALKDWNRRAPNALEAENARLLYQRDTAYKEYDRTKSALMQITARYFAGSIQVAADQKMMDEYLSEGIRQLQEERDAARAQLAAIQGGMGEVVEVVGWRIGFPNGAGYKLYEQRQNWAYKNWGTGVVYEVQDLMTVAQHQRITAAMAAEVERKTASRDKLAAILRDLVPGCKWRIMRPRIDAALLEIENGDQ